MGSRPGGRGKRRLQCWAVTAGLLLLGCALSGALLALDHTGGFVSMIFVLVVVLVARLTDGYAYGAAASFVGVVCVNYIFTYPYWEFNFTISGYPLTFFTMLSVSLIVSALTSQIKRQEQLRVETDRETMRANLLRAVSHDLRTPLTSIVGSASAILENDALLPPQQKTALLRNVRSEAQWLIRMVENLLSITRMGDGTARLSKELEAAEEVLSSVAGKFQQRFPGIQLTLTAPREALFVPMDAILIEQVLMNLLENAAAHGQSSAILLSAERQSAGAVFTVRDNGLGIPEEILPEIFSPALPGKLHAGDDRRNMGIGLSVCSSIVKAHGGSMSACNVREGGAMFRFTLPLEESEEVLS
ncbi:MAG: DUF4118 domain-containing protein [Oscillospiraceae bacterium]|jgi:two-component system sensor histidine kinase KdpD|nr:DUF4118 domain-containing protein [Oscillospiraceae bacterium]